MAVKFLQNNLVQRILSTIILGPLFLTALLYSATSRVILMTVLFLLMQLEWFHIARSRRLIYICGLIYITLPFLFINLDRLPLIFIIVWACDIFAYIGGRLIGGPKFAPTISPKKTWSGVICGIVMAEIIGIICAPILGIQLSYFQIFLAAVGTVLGDLIESKAKRLLNIKDSGSLIPGHGGILDRFDGYLGAAILLLKF